MREVCVECYSSMVDKYNTIKKENAELKKELSRIQRLPHIGKARASAMIMQVAAKLARKSDNVDAKILQRAVDLWATYTVRLEAKIDKLIENSKK